MEVIQVFTIGFTQKSAEEFFGKLRDAGVKCIVDVRLNNTSQEAAPNSVESEGRFRLSTILSHLSFGVHRNLVSEFGFQHPEVLVALDAPEVLLHLQEG